MSTDLVNLSFKQKNISLAEHAVLNVLAFRANENHECWPSIKSLIESTSADRKTIIKALQLLTDKLLIIKTGELKGRTKSVPVYKLTLSSPKNGTAINISGPVFSESSPKNGSSKQSQKRDMERSFNKDQRKDNFSNSSGPKTLKNIIEKLKSDY